VAELGSEATPLFACLKLVTDIERAHNTRRVAEIATLGTPLVQKVTFWSLSRAAFSKFFAIWAATV